MSNRDNDFPEISMLDLRRKQSVRATFKLSQKAIDAIGLVAIHMGIKQKSLFDHIIENTDELDNLARTIEIGQFKKIPRKQKTFVLSRKTVETLEATSQASSTPRDALVEYSVKKLESIIHAEKIKHRKRKKLQKQVISHFDMIKQIYSNAKDILGNEDPFCRKVKKSVFACRKTRDEINEFIEKSEILEEF